MQDRPRSCDAPTLDRTNARPQDSQTENDGPDLSDEKYCEHNRTRVHCEDCRAGGYAPRDLTLEDDAPSVVA